MGLVIGGEGRGITQFGDGGWCDEFKGILRLGRWLCEKNQLKFIINLINPSNNNNKLDKDIRPSVLVYLVHIQSDWSFSIFPSVCYQVLFFFQLRFSVAPSAVALADEP